MTPTTDHVRFAYRFMRGSVTDIAEFDEWLAGIQADAWDEATAHVNVTCNHNPYREVSK